MNNYRSRRLGCQPKLAIPGARLELVRSYLDNSSKQEIDLLHMADLSSTTVKPSPLFRGIEAE